MGIVTNKPRFWDRILAICAGLPRTVAQGTKFITYNALDFLAGDYLQGDMDSLREFVPTLPGFRNDSGRDDAISLDMIKRRLWDHGLTPEQAALHFGDLEERDVFVKEAMQEFSVDEYETIPVNIDRSGEWREGHPEALLFARVTQDWEIGRRRAIEKYRDDVNLWGSLEVLSFIREIGVQRVNSTSDVEPFQSKGEGAENQPHPAEVKSRCDDEVPACLPLREDHRASSRRDLYRSITLSDHRIAAAWLEDPEQACFHDRVVPLETGDEILLSNEKMLRDRRCNPSGEAAAPSTTPIAEVIAECCANTFAFEKSGWTISYGGRTVPMRDLVGLHYLAVLLSQPHKRIKAARLVSVAADLGATPELGDRPYDQRKLPTRGESQDLSIRSGQPRQELLTPEVKRGYRDQLTKLDAAFQRASDAQDFEKADQIDEEREQLKAALKSATGLGGRTRAFSDADKRAKDSVARDIRYALKQLKQAHPALVDHLHASLEYGYHLRYTPDTATYWLT